MMSARLIAKLSQQPTAFHLSTYTLSDILSSESLSSSLTKYSASSSYQMSKDLPSGTEQLYLTPQKSSLFLVIDAAADYYTLNTALMTEVPPVVADIILDPFLLNIFPQSLVPTAVYIAITAIVGWFMCGIIQSRVRKFVTNIVAVEKEKFH